MIRIILLIVALWFMWAAMHYSARAAVEPIRPDLKQEYRKKAAKKTSRHPVPPCLSGKVRILGGWTIRDQAGNVVALGVLRQRC